MQLYSLLLPIYQNASWDTGKYLATYNSCNRTPVRDCTNFSRGLEAKFLPRLKGYKEML